MNKEKPARGAHEGSVVGLGLWFLAFWHGRSPLSMVHRSHSA
jgi:hypothetical protein